MSTISFLYRSLKPKASLTTRLFYRNNNKNYFIEAKTDIEVSKSYWNHSHFNENLKDDAVVILKNEITIKLLKIENNILLALETTSYSFINKNWLENKVSNKKSLIKNSISTNVKLVYYFNYFIKNKREELKKNTIKRYVSVCNLIQKFELNENHIVYLSEINQEFKNRLVKYCVDQQYAQSTIKRGLRAIKIICFYAERNNITVNPQYKHWRTSFTKNNILQKPIFLSFNEIKSIEKLKLTSKSELRARDWLIINCYTGQRFSDFIGFKTEMIYQQSKKSFIEFTQQKKMTTALHPKVLKVLDKRDFLYQKKCLCVITISL